MKRILEPQLMEEIEQVAAYAAADFSAANNIFIQQIFTRLDTLDFHGNVLDLGCGPADISFSIAQQLPSCQLTAVDGSQAMLDFASTQLQQRPELLNRVTLHRTLLPDSALPKHTFDVIVSNSLLHHLHEPQDLWRTIKHCGKKGALVIVMDLFRPNSIGHAQKIVGINAANEPPVLQQDFYNSLLAAFTMSEVREQLVCEKLEQFDLAQVSERHLCISGQLP